MNNEKLTASCRSASRRLHSDDSEVQPDTTVSKIKEMVATCIPCEQDAAFTVRGIDTNRRRFGTLKMMLCRLCELCSMLPDVLAKAEAVALENSAEPYAGHPLM